MGQPLVAKLTMLVLMGSTLAPLPATAAPQEEQEGQEEPQPTPFEELVVVIASGTEELLLEAPTATSIIDASEINLSPVKNYPDLLRSVAGANVIRTSARDFNISTRGATSVTDPSLLVMLDGRIQNQEFQGLVTWDLLPVDLFEVERIEVIRGAGSAVWGANARRGVVNVITKSPRALGRMTRFRLGGGQRSTGFGSVLHAGGTDPWFYKGSASYFTQAAWARPGPLPDGTPRDIFQNEGTQQPKLDVRVDRRFGPDSGLPLSGGYAGTQGIIHSSLGPFRIDKGNNWHLQSGYSRGALTARAYVQVQDSVATGLLNGVPGSFDIRTYAVSATNTSILANGGHALTYGANARYLGFDIDIAPGGDSRTDAGVFLQDTMRLGGHVTVNAGGRIDHFSVLEDPVLSPRLSVLMSPGVTGSRCAARRPVQGTPRLCPDPRSTRIRVPPGPDRHTCRQPPTAAARR